jgi:hypothetical protein
LEEIAGERYLLENILRKAEKIVFLIGAGISQESGIATFRGTDERCIFLTGVVIIIINPIAFYFF